MNLLFDFTVNKENNSITINREFNAELSLVWDAYTTSEILEQWWAPKPWKAKTKSMNFSEGGHWHYAMCGPSGETHWAYTTYETIQLHSFFTGVDSFTDKNAHVNKTLPQAHWKVSFKSNGLQTLVVTHITYDNLVQLEAIIQMGFKEGYTMAMEGLDDYLDRLLNK